MKCRHCNNTLKNKFVDLGTAPPSNAYLTEADLNRYEEYYPLKIWVCDSCYLVQTEDFHAPEKLFRHDYAYFSGTSTTWLAHVKKYSYDISKELNLSTKSFVIEIGSNDGSLLKNFNDLSIPCLGIEPTSAVADFSESIGIKVLRDFFSESLAEKLSDKGQKADLIIANNVYAHVPDINNFTRGLKKLLKSNGTVTIEFPHLIKLIEKTQFDTIYHEHYSYLSLYTVKRIFEVYGLKIYKVQELETHGGSLRIFGCHQEDKRKIDISVETIIRKEIEFGILKIDTYQGFQDKVDKIKYDLLEFLITQKRAGKKVVAYGAAAKGNTLLNYAGIRTDLIPFVVDKNPFKQGKFMPGSRIPIVHPNGIERENLNFFLILPWNILPEIKKQISLLTKQHIKLLIAIPKLEIFE